MLNSLILIKKMHFELPFQPHLAKVSLVRLIPLPKYHKKLFFRESFRVCLVWLLALPFAP
jgi:hypothetical protein